MRCNRTRAASAIGSSIGPLTTPDALFLAERDASGGWRRLSYAQVREQVGRIAQALLELRIDARQPVVVLSDNSVDHALLALAAMHIGRAVCTVSSAYCRLTKDYGKVKGILDALRPGLVYAIGPGGLRRGRQGLGRQRADRVQPRRRHARRRAWPSSDLTRSDRNGRGDAAPSRPSAPTTTPSTC